MIGRGLVVVNDMAYAYITNYKPILSYEHSANLVEVNAEMLNFFHLPRPNITV